MPKFYHLCLMNIAYLSLGSNIGDRETNLLKSITLLQKDAGEVTATSSLYETEPWKMDESGSFINQLIEIRTSLPADKLMDVLLETETKMGRVRSSGKYESRVIDIDILFYNDAIISSDKLTIPHPLLHQRRFVLEPLAELNPNFVHPVLNKAISALLLECNDTYTVAKIMSK